MSVTMFEHDSPSALLTQLMYRMRSGDTARYHTEHEVLLRRQTTGHHAYNVALLCDWLCSGDPSANLLRAALLHDAGERWAGDSPAPTKRALGLRGLMEEFEADLLMQKTGLALPALNAREAQLLKLADAAEGALFCRRECLLGNRLVGEMWANFQDYARNCETHALSKTQIDLVDKLLTFLQQELSKHGYNDR